MNYNYSHAVTYTYRSLWWPRKNLPINGFQILKETEGEWCYTAVWHRADLSREYQLLELYLRTGLSVNISRAVLH